jgi:hypothetical protein
MLDSKILRLKINRDEPRRRIVAALSEPNRLIFIAITSALLAETPGVVQAIGQQIQQPLRAAINLDGGSASAFITAAAELPEYSYIGSFFCYTSL